ncbi:MAG TPA: hypothetical protein VIS05_10760 [Ilumatobacter sp.]
MIERKTFFGGIVAALAVVGLTGAAARAGSSPPIDDRTLDEIRALIPEGEPGEYDLTEGSAAFGELVETLGETTEVADFGDGSTLTGWCGGFAYSYGEDGGLIDAAIDYGDDSPPIDLLSFTQAFTSSNPFKVDTRGVVVYYGFAPESGDGPLDHSWYIRTSGISLDKGGDPNTNLKNRSTGLVDLAEDLPVKFSAKVKVEGQMTSLNQPPCIGKGHVEFIGNGLFDPIGIGALVVLGGGIFGLLFNARPARTYKA